jgi:hypothetical protein
MARLERGAAVSALARVVETGRLGRFPCLPVRALDRPRDDVLEAAEDRPAIPFVLAEAEPVVGLDVRAAPRAAEMLRSR